MKRRAVLTAAAGLAAAAFIVLAPPSLVEAPRTERVEGEARVLFLGDVMLDRSMREYAEYAGEYGYIFEPMRELLRAHDVIVFNLEGPVTARPSVSANSAVGSAENFVFTFEPESLFALAEAAGGASLVANLDNNHIFNFGVSGVEETEAHLRAQGIAYFGSPLEETDALFIDTRAGPLALVGYNQFGGNATGSIQALRRAAVSGAFPVLFAHWGEEYATSAPSYVKDLARRFAEAGAALVVGAHPHVVEPPERYQGVPFYYSLGNAVFDQYWNDDVSCGAALSVVLRGGAIERAELLPLRTLRTRQTVVGTESGCDVPEDVVEWRRSQ